MTLFTKKKLQTGQALIAQELRQGRERSGLSLSQAAKGACIGERYVRAMESGRFDDLPQGIYGKSFLKEYARFLKLDHAALANLLKESAGNGAPAGELFSRQTPQARYFLSLPRTIRNLGIAAAVLLCLAYLGYSILNLTKPPKLELIYPDSDLATGQNSLLVQGLTEEETEVAINGQPVLPEGNGSFSLLVDLSPGTNEITVTARRKYSRTSTVVRKIIYETTDNR